MNISTKEIERLASLAHLSLSDDEKARLTGEMSSIIEMADKLSKLDIQNVEPTMHAANISNVFREDVAVPSYPTDKILQNAPRAEQACFVVPKAVD